MLSDKKARHFHAGKLRKIVNGIEFTEVAESDGKVFVSKDGRVLRALADNDVRVMRPHDNGHGYTTVTFQCFGNLSRKVYVHRLVFEVFVGEIPEGWDVDHINDVRSDNRVENLQVMTHYDNLTVKSTTVANRRKASRRSIKTAIESQEKPVVCTDADGVEHWFKSSMAAARALGVNFTSISMVLHGYRIKKAGGMMWRFATKEAPHA